MRARTILGLLLVLTSGSAGRTVRAQDGDQIQLGTDLVEVRAVVTDAKGRPVVGLTKDDFEVLDGGTPQSLSFFSQERIVPPKDVVAAPGTGAVATADAAGLPALRTVVLFVDDLHL